MKKICLVNPWVLPVPGVKGGAIESLIDLIIKENEKEHKIDLYVVSVYDMTAEIESKKYKYTHFIYIKTNFISKVCQRMYGILKYHFFKTDIHWLFRYYYKAIKAIRRVKPDLIVVEGGMYEQFIQILDEYDSKQLVAYLHSEVIAGAQEQKIYGRAFAISEYIKTAWCKDGYFLKDDVDVIYNAVDEELYLNCSENSKKQLLNKLCLTSDKLIVMYSGRIIPEKGVYELAKAVTGLSNVVLLIVGGTNFADSKKTDYLKKVEKIASESDNVIMTGYVNKEIINQYYGIADLVCVPSRWEEPAALVTIEAMLMGKPLLVTKAGGMVEYVDEQCAIIIENDNNIVESLRNNIIQLEKNRDLLNKMQNYSLQRSKRFTKNNYYNEFYYLCEKIIGEK